VSLQRDMRASVVDIDAPVAMSQTRQWHGWAVAVDSARIAYVVHEPSSSAGQVRDCVGVQRLPLMICRGWGMVKEDSEALAALIANAWGRAVIAVDNRGSGESVMPVAAPHNEEKEGETCV
jgi:pimeloyl-ACP methyl ester carboxylesterase